MKRIFRNMVIMLSVLMAFTLTFGSCTKSDEYKKYMEDGEIVYTGKIDSVVVYSGNERVYVTGLFIADPKVVKLKAYWNTRKDSIELPVQRTGGIDTLRLEIPIQEGVHNFEFVTYDAQGNKSLPVFKTGASYGDRYTSGLINRPLNRADYFAGDENTTIVWGGIDLTSGATFTEVEYTNTTGELVRQLDSIHLGESILENYLPSMPLRYRTVFFPDTLSIDTFYTSFSSARHPELAYLRNIKYPFQRATFDGARWGTPAAWSTNRAARSNSNGLYGGYELRGANGGSLSLEGGWGNSAVVDGKIYQTTNLQAGSYKITLSKMEKGDAGSVHLVVADGAELPNESDLSTGSLAFVRCSGSSVILEFTLTEAKRVTIGFVGNMPDTGSYFKVTGDILFDVL